MTTDAQKNIRPDRTADMLGHASLSPDTPVVAGTYGTWTLTYTVGAFGIDEGGTVKIARRFASDWQTPQFDKPQEDAYTTAVTNGQAKIKLHYDPKSHFRPWMKCLVIDVYDGSLAPGDTITVTFGDTTGGSRGCRTQSFQESAHELRIFVDPTNASQVQKIPNCPIMPVVAGPAYSLVAHLPADAQAGQAVALHLTARDRWGNPAALPNDITLSVTGDAQATIQSNKNNGHTPKHAHSLKLESAGTLWVTAHSPSINEPTTTSNPLRVSDELPTLQHYWGDLHAQTDATVGTGSETEYFTFARDIARLDFTSHQGNDFQMTDEDWSRLNRVVSEFHVDEKFVVFPGYEWSANSTAGGDRNVFYLEEGMPIIRSSSWQIDSDQAQDLSTNVPINSLFEKLNKLDTSKILCGSHVGGRYADISKGFDAKLGPLIEVVSCWGVFEWLLHDALAQGHIVGVMCNSDGHKGRPGAEGPGAGDFGIAGGLTCVLSPSLTRTDIFDALKNRRCYGTTGARMQLSFEINDQPMGSVLERKQDSSQDATNSSTPLRASVTGAGPLERLELYRGSEKIHEVVAPEVAQAGESKWVRISWQGSRIRGRGRRVHWDGSIASDNCIIQKAVPFSFDSPSDGILSTTPNEVTFRSRTTGDTDGIDLLLNQAASGTLTLKSPACTGSGESAGQWTIDLATLGQNDNQPITQTHGGVDIMTTASRLPEVATTMTLAMSLDLSRDLPNAPSPQGKQAAHTAYWVKAIQRDGHMAWSSPIYL